MQDAKGIQKLCEITGAPVVGETYLVPTVRAHWAWNGARVLSDWPVIGPRHFEGCLHWHLEPRFLTPDQEVATEAEERRHGLAPVDREEALAAGIWWPGLRAARNEPLPDFSGMFFGLPVGPVVFLPLRCRRPTVPREYNHFWGLSREPVDPVRSADGRPLCPHKGADLTNVPCDAEGHAICPLHSLRVRVRSYTQAGEANG